MKSVPFHSFSHSKEHYRFYETSSFSESKARNLIKEAGQDQSGRAGREVGWVGSHLTGRKVSSKKENKRAREE